MEQLARSSTDSYNQYLASTELPIVDGVDQQFDRFTYSNLTGLDTSNIYIDTSPIKWAVQIRKAEIVKFRTLVEGVRW